MLRTDKRTDEPDSLTNNDPLDDDLQAFRIRLWQCAPTAQLSRRPTCGARQTWFAS